MKERTCLEDRNGWNNGKGKGINLKEIRLKNVD
jgi:hypothetical protein